MTVPINPSPTGPVLDFNKASSDPEAPPADGTGGENPSKPEASGQIVFGSQADLDKVIQERLNREKKKINDITKERDTLQTRVTELEPLEAATQSDSQRWEKDKQKLENENSELKAWKAQRERDDLVREIANTKGLPDAFLNRVSGDTPEDIEADVDSLLEAFSQSFTAKPATGSKPTESSKGKGGKADHGGGGKEEDTLPSPAEMAKAMRSGGMYMSNR